MHTHPLLITDVDRVLIVAPHPDDESIGTGGLIATYPEQCKVIVMTDGRYGNSTYAPQHMKTIREKEFSNAMDIVGVKERKCICIEDGTLISHKNAFLKIDYSVYSHIFIPNPNDKHSDHTACYEYVVETIKNAELTNIKVFQYEVHNPMPEVNCHIDITKVMEKKQRMVACHASQMDTHPYEGQVKVLAKYRGYQNEQPDKYLETYTQINLFDAKGISTGTEIELSKYKQFTRVLNQWMSVNLKTNGIAEFLVKNGYSHIAIYGYGLLGKTLYRELEHSDCRVVYIVDKNENLTADDVEVYHNTYNMKKVDVVIITALSYYEEIASEIKTRSGLASLSLDFVLNKIERGLS